MALSCATFIKFSLACIAIIKDLKKGGKKVYQIFHWPDLSFTRLMPQVRGQCRVLVLNSYPAPPLPPFQNPVSAPARYIQPL